MVKTNVRARKAALTPNSHSLPSNDNTREPAVHASHADDTSLRRALPRKAKKNASQLSHTAKKGTPSTAVRKGAAASEEKTVRQVKKGNRQAETRRREIAERIAAREGSDGKSRTTAGVARMEAAKAELVNFDHVLQVPAFVSNPFLAIEGHLNETMECLKPQTPDIGRIKPEV